MKKSPREIEFEKSVNNKFNLYNSLLLNLPFKNLTRVGWLILLAENEKKPPDLVKKLSEFSVRIVFTAHPTQFYPRSVLDIIAGLRSLIRENKINEIDLCLQQLGIDLPDEMLLS
jgi:hypothetical protein